MQDALAAVSCQPQDYAFFTRHGQLVYREPWGMAAGHQWPHISIHRADLHQVLLDAVRERLGAESFITGHRCIGVEQDDDGVTARFAAPDGTALPPQTGDVLIACDGVHSVVRAQFYPDEGPFIYRGTNLWRGVTRMAPYLTGRSIARIGARHSTLIIYPIRNNIDAAGNQLVNWVVRDRARRRGAGRLEQARAARGLPPGLPGLDVRLARRAGDDAQRRRRSCPIRWSTAIRSPRWTFGRVTLLGDAAHPMYPQGGNGGAQAIIDAATLARLLKSESRSGGGAQGLRGRRGCRPPAGSCCRTAPRRRTSSSTPSSSAPAASGSTGWRTSSARTRLRAIFERYQKVAGYHVQQVGRSQG